MKHWLQAILPLLIGILTGPSLKGVLPMRDQWSWACQCLKTGDATAAVNAFQEFETWYANEPEVNEAVFREQRKRLHGLACLQAGYLEQGIGILEDWLSENAPGTASHAFIRFQVASACRAFEKPDRAVVHWKRFIEEHRNLPECNLVNWMWSDQEIADGKPAEALVHLEAIQQHPAASPVCRSLAMAASAMIHLRQGDADTAAQILNNKEYGNVTVFSIWRSMMAPSIIQSSLNAEKMEVATEACSWLCDPEGLKIALSDIRGVFTQNHQHIRSNRAMRQMIWNQHWEDFLSRLDRGMEQQGEVLNSALLYSLKLETLLKGGDFRQCTYLARAIIQSPSMGDPDLQARAYETSILARHQLKEWDIAHALADAFIQAFPEDPRIPDILLLDARTAAGQKQYTKAIDQVTKLLDAWPYHPACPSWELLKGEWLLVSGQPGRALDTFRNLEKDAREAWTPYLLFQKGRCLEALKKLDQAIQVYHSVTRHDHATPALAELSMTGLLKIHLRTLDSEQFQRVLDSYRKQFPEGLYQYTVQTLAGSFHFNMGDLDQAESCFLQVAGQDHSAADYAHVQLSRLYQHSGDTQSLCKHALEWIRQYSNLDKKIPETPFKDCRYVQKVTGRPAYGPADLQSILEWIDRGSPRIPAPEALGVLAHQWKAYQTYLAGPGTDILDWCEERAREHFLNDHLSGFAAYKLFASSLLEEAGRLDTADAMRIQVIQAGDPQLLPESSCFVLCRTAAKYDFPNAASQMTQFLDRFPESRSRPEALYLLGMMLKGKGESNHALPLFHEIIVDWPDSSFYVSAGLELAAQYLEVGQNMELHGITGHLLERPDLNPLDTATALILRAQADFNMQQPERAAISCIRILCLYPDIHDIGRTAQSLLLKYENHITNPNQRQFIESLRHSPVGFLNPDPAIRTRTRAVG